jgi:hypothetical protein
MKRLLNRPIFAALTTLLRAVLAGEMDVPRRTFQYE